MANKNVATRITTINLKYDDRDIRNMIPGKWLMAMVLTILSNTMKRSITITMTIMAMV